MIAVLGRALPLGLLGGILLARNWEGWVDPLVDFGRELFVPWRITQGAVLYRDLAYLDGPLSPYLNALWFTVLPVSLRTLELANLAGIVLVCVLIFALLRRMGSELAAWAGVALFLLVFAFNLIGRGGNMNWVAPYSHGLTHGLIAALLGLWFLVRYHEHRRTGDLVAVGLALGAALLTKPEVSAAAGASLGVGVAASLAGAPSGRRRAGRELAVFAGASLLPACLAVALLAAAMPLGQAVSGTLGGWAHLARTDVGDLHFYRWVMGVDTPGLSLRLMAEFAWVWGRVLVPALVISLVLRRPGPARTGLALALGAALLVLPYRTWLRLDWAGAFRPLTAVATVFVCFAAFDAWRHRGGPGSGRTVLQLAFAVLALALLPKVLLKPGLWGYSFALAVPAAMVLVLVLVHTIPAAVERHGGHGAMFRGVALGLLLVAGVGCLRLSEEIRVKKTFALGEGGDRLVADRFQVESKLVKRLMRWVETELPPGASILVMPEGVMVNYLTRRPNGNRHFNFVPPEVVIFGETRIRADLEAHPPDYVALVHRSTEEYGVPLFGRDYATRLLDWVHDGYERVTRVGAVPLVEARLKDGQSGFEIWRRKAPRAAPAG